MSRHGRGTPRRPLTVTVAGLGLLLGGCALGERPELAAAQPEAPDPAIDAVLERLDAALTASFEATFQVVAPAGPTAEATVRWTPPDEGVTTVRDVRYVTTAGTVETCDVPAGACRAGVDDAPLSDLGITSRFWSESAATRLRRDGQRRIGPPEASTIEVAGQPATCVLVPIDTTATRYCALDAGPLAVMQTTDVSIELTAYTPG